MRAAAITVSTSRSRDPSGDQSGPALAAWIESLGLELAGTEIVPDDRAQIAERLRFWADSEHCSLVVTSGGTGLAPTDVTPEATADVIDRPVPGIAEAMRLASREHTPNWMLSRGVAGVRGETLLVNFPGAPKAIEETAGALGASIRHALDLIAGRDAAH